MSTRTVKSAVVAMAMGCAALAAQAVTVTAVFYTASTPPAGYGAARQIALQDVTLAQARPDAADGANAITHFGKELSGGAVRLLVDFSEVFETTGPNISSAELYMYHWASRTRTNVAWSANLLTRAWVEHEATWNSAEAGQPWATPGGDFAASPNAAGTVVCAQEGRHVFDVTALAQVYAQNNMNYHGVVIHSEDTLGAEPMYFGVDNGMMDVAQQPYLVVAYDYDDDTAPQIVIENPANGVTTRVANVVVSGSAWDDIGLTEVRVNGVLASGLGQWQAALTLSAGLNAIQAIAKDTSGNSATATIY